jgi:acetylglutamate kinase
LYNINADHMAAACAEYLHADQLIYLTDVAGVLDGERVLSAVTCEEVERLVQCRVVSGGMILKLEAAKRAIEGGVREVRIVGGASPDSLLLASHATETPATDSMTLIPGTRVLREPLSAAQAAYSAA